jgi:signal peptidase I
MGELRRWLFLLTISVIAATVLRTFFFETVSVATPSMEPTLFVNTHYLVNRFVYRLRQPKRGEIISFLSPVDGQTPFIKRVIAVPGDIVELRAKRVYLNGAPTDEPYAVYKRAGEALVGDNLGPLEVPPDHVFVLGDNRDVSLDSTGWRDPSGKPIYFLPLKNIRGRLMQLG